jgi:polysaccharide pyruvyl transferase WcaK-like protein/predicted GH43/DUF377 family glycosyl hydrolase
MIYNLNKYFDIKLNEYIFNNSIIEYDNHYIMVYRHIIYKNKNKLHPWSAWCRSYEQTNKEIINNNKELLVNIKLFNINKYRNDYDNDFFINISNNIYEDNKDEIDTTGLCIFTKNDDIDKMVMVYNNPFIFKKYNQDSRIYNINNEIYITYNGFFKKDDDLQVKLLYRKIIFNFKYNNIYMGDEYPLINKDLYIERKVEKNCVFDNNKNVIYDINGIFKYIDNKKGFISKVVIQLKNIIDFYGKDNIFFSLGTPISYIYINSKKYNISLGHVKVNFKNIKKNTEFYNFLKSVNYKNIKLHGKYIYFMFFYVFDDNYNITHLSYSFIPTDDNNSHFPYLLVFPTGFYKTDNYYLISYGEGDEFSKLFTLKQQDILNLLIPIENINDNYKFLFYNVNKKKYIENKNIKNYLIYGYYSMFNAGDDAFKIAFNNLIKGDDKEIYYANPSTLKNYFDIIFDKIIVGGGDVVNSYFIDPLINFNKNNLDLTAISIGIPFLENIHYLNLFKEVYLRNRRDYNDIINNKYEIDKNINFYYIPDICFCLDIVKKDIDISFNKNKINVGMFLCRPFYKKDYEKEYCNIVNNIVILINNLLNINKDIIIYLIPFNINNNNNKENDCILNNQLKSLICNDRVINIEYKFFDKDFYVNQINNLISNLDFGICSRFHSHIFCFNNNIPFISLSCTRKVYELLKELDFLDLYSEIECFDYVPISFDIEKTLNLFLKIFNNKNKYKEILQNKKNEIKTINNLIL